jgi:ribosomal protein L31E
MVTERIYNVPLRKGFRKTARYKKTKKAVTILKEFLSRHLKQKDIGKVYIGRNLNQELWKHGIKNPPAQVKIVVIKEDNGDVKAELFGYKYDHKKKEQKDKEEKKDSKVEEKAKESKGKSANAEKKAEHKEHVHDSKDVHEHDEKHEHAARVHEARPELATPKKNGKKKTG